MVIPSEPDALKALNPSIKSFNQKPESVDCLVKPELRTTFAMVVLISDFHVHPDSFLPQFSPKNSTHVMHVEIQFLFSHSNGIPNMVLHKILVMDIPFVNYHVPGLTVYVSK